MGLTIKRVFSANGVSAVAWEKRTAHVKGDDGRVIFELHDVEVPSGWSQLATDILASKYLRKAGLYGDASRGETSAAQVVARIADTVTVEGIDRGYIEGETADVFYDELTAILLGQVAAFNSPVWFNCGLFRKYDIRGQGGNWAVDIEAGDGKAYETLNAYARPQSSACFIQAAPDDLMGLYELLKNEARLFKQGSGTGSNFSAVRGRQEKLSGGGSPSGLMSFLEVFDRATASTKSGGTTRRAAKMVCLDMDHPEILDFINWKTREEKKAHALIAAGYDSDFNGEAYHTISGQNSNNSVRVTDEFMRDAINGTGTWATKMRTTGEVVDVYEARFLWEAVAKSAWACADPGVQYHDTINRWNTCPNSGEIKASNPCSEYMHLENTACNLASVNLVKFLRADGTIDLERFEHVCRVMFLAQEILVDLSSYPTKVIAENAHRFREIGLGFANLGTLLMRMGLPYDSDAGRHVAKCISAILHGTAYATSAEIANVMGPFAGFKENADAMRGVMRMHARALNRDQPYIDVRGIGSVGSNLLDRATEIWGYVTGAPVFRNSQATVIAPTGTIGLLMDCDTTGIEPDFALVKTKKLAGGGTVRIVNQSVEHALRSLGYSDGAVREALLRVETDGELPVSFPEKDRAIFDCAMPAKPGGRCIAPMGHIKMMEAVQPFVSGAISKTINVPQDATVADIKNVYEEGWIRGLKAVAVYRDGCKLSQPLNVGSSKTPTPAPTSEHVERPPVVLPTRIEPIGVRASVRVRLPKRRGGWTQEARIAGHKIYLRTGEYPDGTLGEIFLDMHRAGATLRATMHALAMAVSAGLQHGVPLATFVNQFVFTSFEPQGLVEGHPQIKMVKSIIDYVFRALAIEYLGRKDLAHVPDANTISEDLESVSVRPSATTAPPTITYDGPPCDVCGHITVRNGTCHKCLNCGNSMGCS